LWDDELEAFEFEPPAGKLGRNPSKRITETISAARDFYAERTNQRGAFTPDEAAIVLDVARTHAPRLYPLLRVALATGMRGGEIRALQWDDVDLGQGIVEIRHNFSADVLTSVKTGRKGRRIALLPPGCHELLTRMAQGKRSLFVFTSSRGSADPISSSSLTGWMKLTMQEAVKRGVREGLTFHSTRHAFVSQARMRGVPEAWLERQVWGGETIKGGYTHLDLAQRPDLTWADYSQPVAQSWLELAELAGETQPRGAVDGTH
jgi:integrase